jgi:hypothetical protein
VNSEGSMERDMEKINFFCISCSVAISGKYSVYVTFARNSGYFSQRPENRQYYRYVIQIYIS